jgi:aminoglycoside phosphotransferase (APT) family kinase protein
MTAAGSLSGADRPETAPVRPGEDLDRAALADWLRRELPAVGLAVSGEMALAQFPNGHANLTYLATFGSGTPDEVRLVVRRPPLGRIAPGAHDMKREFRVLSRLWRVYDRAPRAYLLCTDPAVLGADFLVTEYRPGVVVWDSWPPALGEGPDIGRRVGAATVDALADLHRVDVAAAGLGDLGRPAGYLARQVEGWRGRWELVATAELDARMTALAEELRATLPVSAAPVVLHNDFKIDNCQFAAGRPDRVASVFDWDMATLGDPLADLGMLLNYWPDPADVDGERPLHVPGLETMGLPTRAEVAARYAERTGADLSRIAWYEAFCSWKIAVVCQQLSIRWLRGESTDPRMAEQAGYPPRLLRRAERLLGVAA